MEPAGSEVREKRPGTSRKFKDSPSMYILGGYLVLQMYAMFKLTIPTFFGGYLSISSFTDVRYA